ncbi:hypothetical protein [Pseudophaeobacter sp.]|uniref:hypothetical protein n=1 Tax=Pseudophaeobacter sp. TaxID=1971739 RepID=UPI003299F52A
MLIKTFKTTWASLMDDRENPLQNIPLPAAYMLMQLLAWMWSAVFSISIGSYLAFGISSIAHVLILSAVFTTLVVFQSAQNPDLLQKR